MKKLISIVIPAYNEEEGIEELKRQLQSMMDANQRYDFEVIIVENGSFDSSYEMLEKINAEDSRFKIVQLSRNFNCDGGITAGLMYASGDAAVIMMADLQEPPELIPRFIEKWEEGYDVVYGIVLKRKGIGFIKTFFSKLFYKIMYVLTDKMLPENVSDFRLMDRKVYQSINRMNEHNRLLRGMIAWSGFKQTGIPFERQERFAGETKWDYVKAFSMTIHAILSFSYFPLKIASLLGFMVSILSFIAGVFEILSVLIFGREVPGFATLVTVMLFMFGIVIMILGIIGEYIAMIYEEVKQRPNFIVRNLVGFQKIAETHPLRATDDIR